MRELHSWRHRDTIVIPHGVARYFILWLSCGHSGGTVKAGYAVVKKRCAHCRGYREIVKVEPRVE